MSRVRYSTVTFYRMTGLLAALTACGDSAGSSPSGTRLAFVVQPATTRLRHVISPAIMVEVQNEDGSRVRDDVDISLTIGNNPSGASLIGTTTHTAIDGVATFSSILIDRAASGYTLTATASGLTAATSASFTIHGFTALSAASFGTCGLLSNGAAYCWGDNRGGLLGIGVGELGPQACQLGGCSLVPVPVSGNLTLTNLSANGAHACGITTGSSAYCWGYNRYAELGAVTATESSTVPIPVSGGFSFATVSSGLQHSCGLTSGGAAYCWGHNLYGELGIGAESDSIPLPTPVVGSLTFASIHPGGVQTCGLTISGVAYCWGGGSLGDSGAFHPQCGNTGIPCSPSPVPVAGGFTFREMSAGSGHTCAITTSDVAYCWGINDFGQLGDSTTTFRTYPVPVSGAIAFASLSAGGYHTCGLTAAGKAYCWGTNAFGELGNLGNVNRWAPVPVFGQYSFSALAAGFYHTCGLAAGGLVYCWGHNRDGELGNGAQADTNVPGQIIYP